MARLVGSTCQSREEADRWAPCVRFNGKRKKSTVLMGSMGRKGGLLVCSPIGLYSGLALAHGPTRLSRPKMAQTAGFTLSPSSLRQGRPTGSGSERASRPLVGFGVLIDNTIKRQTYLHEIMSRNLIQDVILNEVTHVLQANVYIPLAFIYMCNRQS